MFSLRMLNSNNLESGVSFHSQPLQDAAVLLRNASEQTREDFEQEIQRKLEQEATKPAGFQTTIQGQLCIYKLKAASVPRFLQHLSGRRPFRHV
uniref:Ras-associating domain-containing protein n=1 Tax=Macrostomum lignano TaxID=282301 RepID=A0A1I8JID6_9PLAT